MYKASLFYFRFKNDPSNLVTSLLLYLLDVFQSFGPYEDNNLQHPLYK